MRVRGRKRSNLLSSEGPWLAAMPTFCCSYLISFILSTIDDEAAHRIQDPRSSTAHGAMGGEK